MHATRAQLLELVQGGTPLPSACLRLRVSLANGKRWLAAAQAEAEAAREGLAVHRRSHCGRKPVTGMLTDDQLQELVAWVLRGNGHVAGGVQAWARDPNTKCPPEFRAWVTAKGCNKHSIPPSIRKAVYASPDVIAALKGPKAFAQQFAVGRLPDEAVGEAGDYFEVDDMSSNHPYFFELGPRLLEGEGCYALPEGLRGALALTRNGSSEGLANRQGLMVGRQGLYACDRRSGYWLHALLIGTAKDAYTAADILVFLRELFERHGFPRKGLIMERGIWNSKTVDGMVTGEAVIAGLKSLGFKIIHAHESKGKCFIEASFDELQGHMQRQNRSLYIGRERGEMEDAAKIMRALRAGARDPGQAKVWHIRDAVDGHRAAMELHNLIPRAGEHQRGIPKEVWEASIAANPLRMPTKDDLAVFLPELLETKIRGMHVEKKKDGERYRWTAPALFGSLGNEYRVAIRFDSERPDEGCALYNLEPVNSSRNAQGLKPGEFMGWALPDDCGARQGLMKTARKAFRTRHAVTLGAARKIEGAEPKPGEAASLRTANSVPRSPIPISRETPAPSAERLAELKQFEDEFDQALA